MRIIENPLELIYWFKIDVYVTGHFVFCSAGGQGSESTNDNFGHYGFIEVSTLVNTALGTSLYSSTK